MVIGTTSRKDLLNQLEMIDSFSAVIRAPCLTESSHLHEALKLMDSFSQSDLDKIMKKVNGKR